MTEGNIPASILRKEAKRSRTEAHEQIRQAEAYKVLLDECYIKAETAEQYAVECSIAAEKLEGFAFIERVKQ